MVSTVWRIIETYSVATALRASYLPDADGHGLGVTTAHGGVADQVAGSVRDERHVGACCQHDVNAAPRVIVHQPPLMARAHGVLGQ